MNKKIKLYAMLSEACLVKKEYDNAILYSKKCLTIAQESDHKEDEMLAYKTLRDAHLLKEEYDDAIFYSKKRLTIAQDSGDKEGEMDAYLTFGVAHLKKQEYDDAILYSKKWLTIAQESGHKLDEMTAYMTLGDAHLWKGEYDDAIFYSQKLLTIAQESGHKLDEMAAYKKLGVAHLKKEEYDDAILYSKKCLTIAQESGDKEDEKAAYLTLGDAHLMKEEYDDAILYSRKCLTMAQNSGLKIAEIAAYKTLGGAHLKKEEYDDAILYSKKWLTMAQESVHKEAEMDAYMSLGDAHLHKEEYDDAILYSKKWLTIAQESGHKEDEMKAYKALRDAHLLKKEYDDAIFYSKKLLTIAQESGDKEAEMKAYMTLGDAHLKKEEYDDAILYSRKCIPIAQESGHKKAEIDAYITLGFAHWHKEEYDNAILYSKKWLTMAQESRHKEDEMAAYLTLGDAHLQKEEYDDAILYSRKYLTMAQDSGHKDAEMAAYKTLGGAHLKKEEYDDAHSCFIKGIIVARYLNNEKQISTCEFYCYMIYYAVGISEEYKEKQMGLDDCAVEIATAHKNEEKVTSLNSNSCLSQDAVGISKEHGKSVKSVFGPHLEMLEKHIRLDDRVAQNFRSFENHRANHEYKKAISCLQEAMVANSPTQGNGSHQSLPFLWHFNYLISEAYLLLGEHDKAMQCQQEALGIAQKYGSKNQQGRSHFFLGKYYYELHQLEKAEKSLRESLKWYELLFSGLKENDRFKIAFVDKYKEIYKMLLKVLIETNKKEEALALSEHYRARSLRDILASCSGIKKEQMAKDGLQYADIQSFVSSSNYTLLFYSTCFKKLCTFLLESGKELGFSVQHFEYCDSCLDKLVLEAFGEMKVRQVVNCAERSLDFMDNFEENRNRHEDELTKLLTRQKEKMLSEQSRCTCGCRGDPSENSDESSLTSGLEKLYHKLLQNVKCLIKQDEVVIIPEGPLCKVPFAALRDPDTGQYLSETKRIRMAPSIATLKLLQEYPVEHHSSKDALVIGASVVGKFIFDGEETEFASLDGAVEEADEVAKLLGVRQPLLAGMATKPLVLKRLQEGASVVHIAAHGSLEKAAIVLAPSPEIRKTKIPDEEDYLLTMADVQQVRVRAQLVVLGCCYSGRGRIKAEGVIGMCRAFLASGARAVVGSLWAVDDEATFEFMITFYGYLKEGKSANTSLHLTMNDMRRTPKYSEPKYWAPFFLMGDDVTIQFDN